MVKSAFGILAAAAVTGIVLSPGVASAGTAAPAALAYSSGPSASDPDSTVTFTVTVGGLTMTAPDTANLGSGAPATTITGALGTVTVTDLRALLAGTWTATASATSWTTGAGTPNETIPAGDVGYGPGGFTTIGTVNPTGTPITLSGAATPVVTATGVGNSTTSWNPTLSVAVPPAAVGGVYTSTLTQSVS